MSVTLTLDKYDELKSKELAYEGVLRGEIVPVMAIHVDYEIVNDNVQLLPVNQVDKNLHQVNDRLSKSNKKLRKRVEDIKANPVQETVDRLRLQSNPNDVHFGVCISFCMLCAGIGYAYGAFL